MEHLPPTSLRSFETQRAQRKFNILLFEEMPKNWSFVCCQWSVEIQATPKPAFLSAKGGLGFFGFIRKPKKIS